MHYVDKPKPGVAVGSDLTAEGAELMTWHDRARRYREEWKSMSLWHIAFPVAAMWVVGLAALQVPSIGSAKLFAAILLIYGTAWLIGAAFLVMIWRWVRARQAH